MNTCFFGCFLNDQMILNPTHIPQSNIFLYRQIIAREILEDRPQMLTKFLRIELADIDTIPENLPFCGIVKAGQELNQCCFTRAIETNESQTLFRREKEINMP